MAKERFFNLPVLILIASSFMLGMSEFIVVGILPDIAADLKISEVTVGNLVSLFAFVYAPVTPLGSALSARFPRFATHLTLIGIFLAGNLLCAFAPNYAVLVVARIMIALVSGTLVAVAMTYAPDVTTDKFRTKFIAWVFSGFSIASVVGVPVGTWVANTFGWRWAFHIINVLTIMLIVGMVVALPRNSHIVKIGFLPQFRLFFDRRIQLGVLTVVFGAAASYVFYTYLTPIMRDEVHVPEQYLSVGLVIFGAACLWSNLYGGKLADRGRGVEPLTHIRPIYCAHAVLMASLVVAHWVPVYGSVAARGTRHVHVSAEFRVTGAVYGCRLTIAPGIAQLGRVAQFHVVQHRHRAWFRGRRSGQRTFRTDMAWPGWRAVPAMRDRHYHHAASVRGAGTQVLCHPTRMNVSVPHDSKSCRAYGRLLMHDGEHGGQPSGFH